MWFVRDVHVVRWSHLPPEISTQIRKFKDGCDLGPLCPLWKFGGNDFPCPAYARVLFGESTPQGRPNTWGEVVCTESLMIMLLQK